jgi:hypothetical protein
MAVLCLAGVARAETVFYVAGNGSDTWSGRLAAVNAAKTDGPFATLNRARDEVRKLPAAKRKGGATVIVRGGTYFLDAPLELSAQDSGTASGRIIYAAYPGEEVRISGGREVKNFKRVTDPAVLGRLSESARVRVRQTDLKSQGITNFGAADAGGLEVFHEDTPLWPARWPNQGFVKIGELVVNDGLDVRGTKGSRIGKFHYDGDRAQRWTGEKDPWLHGYWFWDWSDQRQQLESIDLEKKILTVKPPYHGYGYRKGQWYYAFNMLSELDAPGEFCLDREMGILYVWAPTELGSGRTVVSVLENLVVMKDVSNVAFSGFTFEAARGTAVRVEGGERVLVERSLMRNLGGYGAEFTGEGHRIAGCEIYQTGKGGIKLAGGDRKTLKPGGLFAENNHIHHYGRVFRMYHAGVSIDGVGNRAANNLIHSAPHIAIFFAGNEHVIEYNEIHHVSFESNDAGAIYAGRDWTMRGNVIRHNFLHDITGFENRGCVGVYLDDMFASAAIYGNVFRNVTRAAFIGGGRDCTVENNIFIECKPALHVDARALGWAGYHADGWIKEAREKSTLLGIAYKQAPYATRYPKLPSILDDEPKAPKGNLIARNISIGGRWDEIEKKAHPYLTLENNLLDQDPRFVDAAGGDYRLRADSPAFKLGFKPIPMESIGLFNGGFKSDAGVRQALERAGAAPLGLARDARLQKDYGAADRYFHKAASDADTRIEWGNTLIEAARYNEARRALRQVAADAKARPERRSIAQMQIARSFVFEKRHGEAIAAYAKVKAIPGIPPQHIWEAQECVKELDREKAGLAARDPQATRTKLAPLPQPGKTIFVSPQGTDSNAGTREQPLGSLARAVDEVRRIKRAGLPKGGVRVEFAGGVYRLPEGVKIGEDASGTQDSPVVFASAAGAQAVFHAGVKLGGFEPVTDPAILARLPEQGRGKTLQINLNERGITQYGTLGTRGFNALNPNNASLELYFNGQPMTTARWPNEGFVRTGRVLETGLVKEGKTGRFVFDSPRMERWRTARDPMLYGYWVYDWADCTVGVVRIDFTAKEIQTAHGTVYGFKEGQPFRVFNLLEEIDAPGEWYLDRASGMLYFYPPQDPAKAVIELSMVEEPLALLAGASHVTLKGLTFELGRGDGLVVNGGERNRVLACTFRRLGGTGVTVEGGTGHVIMASNLHTLGRGGVSVTGGDRKTLVPAGHVVENCHVYDFSRIDRTYTPAVYMEGAGIRIAHNRFHDTPAHGMRIEGNDHLIEFNEVYNVVRETDDQGGIDMFYNPTYRGTVIRHNYWHDINNGEPCGQAGIRLDDGISGTLVYGNVFHRASGANFGGVQIHGGKDNWIENNLFVDSHYAISLSQWSDKRWGEFLASRPVKGFIDAVKIAEPPYGTKYPDLARITEKPYVNRVWRNLAVNSVKFLARDRVKQDQLDNTVTRIDPGFLDMASGKLGWKAGAAGPRSSSFRPIPFEEIGLYTDELRPALPAR